MRTDEHPTPAHIRLSMAWQNFKAVFIGTAVGVVIAVLILLSIGAPDEALIVFLFGAALVVFVFLWVQVFPHVYSTLLDDRRPLSIDNLPSAQAQQLVMWQPPARPWREQTGIRCIESLKSQLQTVEERLAELDAVRLRLHDPDVKDSDRWMIHRVHRNVKRYCAGDYDTARELVRRIEWIWAGNVTSEIRDREDELWRATRQRSEAPAESSAEYIRSLDEWIRNIEREIAELKECGKTRSVAQEDVWHFNYYRFTRHLDLFAEIFEKFEHPAIRDRELCKALERMCWHIQNDPSLSPAEKRRQIEAARDRYRDLTGKKWDSSYQA
jgi:hypothetical protein